MNSLLSKYLTRIGFSSMPDVSLKTLEKLHMLHTHAIPFENLTPYSHEKVSLDPNDLFKKFLEDGRGGYCFEQNLLFSRVLKEIGFKVTHLGARVLWNQPEETITRRSHMLLSVEIGRDLYLADVGFGGLTLTTPIKFVTDLEQKTTHEDFRIAVLENDLKLQAKVGGVWKTLYRFDTQVQYLEDYEVSNFYLYTHQSSIFRNTLIAAKPFSGGRVALSNRVLTTYNKGGDAEKKTLESVEEVKTTLREVFGLKLPLYPGLDSRLRSLFE